MDNFHFDMTSRGVHTLRQALALFGAAVEAGDPERRVCGYAIDPERGMVLYCSPSPQATLLPFEMSLAQAAEFAHEWLVQRADYGQRPDIDGDCEKGWRLYCQEWGRIGGDDHAFAAVKPAWAMYGR